MKYSTREETDRSRPASGAKRIIVMLLQGMDCPVQMHLLMKNTWYSV